MPRPIRPPAWDIDTTIARLHAALDRQPADVPVAAGRAALAHLKAQRAARWEIYQLRHTAELYAQLVDDYNAIWDAARQCGVEVYQLPNDANWTWTRGDRRGSAPTPAAALIAALIAA